MHEAGRLLVQYLVNSVWQTPLLLTAAWIASRILRKLGCAVQHRIWVAALALAVLAPVWTIGSRIVSTQPIIDSIMNSGAANLLAAPANPSVVGDPAPGTIRLLPPIYFGLLFGYLAFLVLAGFRLG